MNELNCFIFTHKITLLKLYKICKIYSWMRDDLKESNSVMIDSKTNFTVELKYDNIFRESFRNM